MPAPARFPGAAARAAGRGAKAVRQGCGILSEFPFAQRMPMLGNNVRKLGRMLQTPLGVRDVYSSSSEEWERGVPVATERRLRAPIDDAGEIAGSPKRKI